jgi:acyl dehydratase
VTRHLDLASRPGAVRMSKTIAESDVYTFAGITGDFYPVHVDAEYAARQPVGQRVAHGVLILGLMSAAAARWMIQHSVDGLSYGYDAVRFVKPVLFGDTITVSYAEISATPDRRRITCGVQARNQHGEVVGAAEHIIWSAR